MRAPRALPGGRLDAHNAHLILPRALTVLVEYATETLPLERLVGVTDVPNIASDRLLRRVGFVPCAETDGPRHRLRHYRLERERTLVDPINSSSSRAG